MNEYLLVLANSPLQISLKTIAKESRIPDAVLQRLAEWHIHGDRDTDVVYSDFHIVFANLLFRYPTVRIWETGEEVFFEL